MAGVAPAGVAREKLLETYRGNLAEAASHPEFVYRPETGEEIYHSFLGVPILRGGISCSTSSARFRTSTPVRHRSSRPRAQSPTPDLRAAAEAAADVMGLPLEEVAVGDLGLEAQLELLLQL